MSASILTAVAGIAGKVLDRLIPDKAEASRIKSELTIALLQEGRAELDAATSVIIAEASGDSALQRNWRPITMLWFAGLVGAHWLGFTPENLSETQVLALLGIVQVGIGGYVIGRSAEKAVKAWKKG